MNAFAGMSPPETPCDSVQPPTGQSPRQVQFSWLSAHVDDRVLMPPQGASLSSTPPPEWAAPSPLELLTESPAADQLEAPERSPAEAETMTPVETSNVAEDLFSPGTPRWVSPPAAAEETMEQQQQSGAIDTASAETAAVTDDKPRATAETQAERCIEAADFERGEVGGMPKPVQEAEHERNEEEGGGAAEEEENNAESSIIERASLALRDARLARASDVNRRPTRGPPASGSSDGETMRRHVSKIEQLPAPDTLASAKTAPPAPVQTSPTTLDVIGKIDVAARAASSSAMRSSRRSRSSRSKSTTEGARKPTRSRAAHIVSQHAAWLPPVTTTTIARQTSPQAARAPKFGESSAMLALATPISTETSTLLAASRLDASRGGVFDGGSASEGVVENVQLRLEIGELKERLRTAEQSLVRQVDSMGRIGRAAPTGREKIGKLFRGCPHNLKRLFTSCGPPPSVVALKAKRAANSCIVFS